MCGMDAEASSSARALYLIRQAQVVEELLRGARMVGGEITERVAAFVRRGTALLGHVECTTF